MPNNSRQNKCLQIDISNGYKLGFSYAVWLESRGPEMSFKLFESIVSDKSFMSQYNDEYEAEVNTELNRNQSNIEATEKRKKPHKKNEPTNTIEEIPITNKTVTKNRPASKIISSGARFCNECGRHHQGNVCY
ncbi:hypothetical protein ACFP2F_12300 [Hymenobacter artigasi]|uniref:Uncharacterized protein n=1 Tax=Hymenobacter artigasi TaxID=2719616 RepID=A0ABX1HGL2_9BACT|nr:hypothetical protein [Hymenobacter artigasi]NKI89389.1 hypothetical protein [Hymenobacter artigasi]